MKRIRLLPYLETSESLSPLDLRLAALAARSARNETEGDLLAVTAALVSRMRAQGHSCLHLRRWAGRPLGEDPEAPRLPGRDAWRTLLERSDWVAQNPELEGEPLPLVLDAEDRVYLWRYWQAEQRLARQLARRAGVIGAGPTPAPVQALFQRLFPPADDPELGGADFQALAAVAALTRPVALISGGPGTGKTTTVTRILALLTALEPEARIALAAPTGKAAARLQESIAEQLADLPVEPEIRGRIPRQASTLHRLLGYFPRQDRFRYHAESPLPVDILVVDEASMVDLLMMGSILQALPADARLILLGDRNQLASVDTGFVFGDLIQAAGLQFGGRPEESIPPSLIDAYNHLAVRPWPWHPGPAGGEDQTSRAEETMGLQGCGVELQISYRFRSREGIGKLATAIRQADLPVLHETLHAGLSDVSWVTPDAGASWLEPLKDDILGCVQAGDPARALARLQTFRILAATRVGAWGIQRLNDQVEDFLEGHGLPTQERFYSGRPILVESNDYQSRLFNGDLGVVWQDRDGLWAFFADESTAPGLALGDLALPGSTTAGAGGPPLRRLPLAKLPRHSTAWAMTVHKSQGSELDRVLLVLPERDIGDLLTRELLYTAVTRAKQKVHLFGDLSLIERAVGRSSRRSSGLVEALNQAARDLGPSSAETHET